MADTPLRDDGQGPGPAHDGPATGAPDVERIAERVYRMMLDEMRLARARSASGGTRQGG